MCSIDLVGHADDVVGGAQLRDQVELGPAEHLARRVVRRVDDDDAGAVREGSAQLGLVEGPVGGPQVHEARHRPGQDGVGPVVLVHRVEQDDLVTRIDQGQQRGDHCLGRPAGHADLPLRVDPPAGVGAPDLLGDRGTEVSGAPGDGVLVDVSVKRRLGRLLELRRAGEVGEALRQVHRIVLQREARHLPDHRFGEARSAHARAAARLAAGGWIGEGSGGEAGLGHRSILPPGAAAQSTQPAGACPI